MKNYNKELKFLIKLVKKSEKIIKNGKMEVKDKGENDLVTNLDLEVEQFINKNIKKKYPQFDIVSEEFFSNKTLTKNCFTVDPIDGTINFAHNLPFWAIQVSCVIDGETKVAVIYSPSTKELYYAVKGEGAFLNGKQIRVTNSPMNKIIFTAHGHQEASKYVTKIYEQFHGIANNYRRFGATSFTFAYIAKGALGGTVIFAPNIWDINPGILLCKEAGAEIDYDPNGNLIVGYCKEFNKIMLEKLNKILSKNQ